jgi:hypothetical protein
LATWKKASITQTCAGTFVIILFCVYRINVGSRDCIYLHRQYHRRTALRQKRTRVLDPNSH